MLYRLRNRTKFSLLRYLSSVFEFMVLNKFDLIRDNMSENRNHMIIFSETLHIEFRRTVRNVQTLIVVYR
jgi:hypothetical protein